VQVFCVLDMHYSENFKVHFPLLKFDYIIYIYIYFFFYRIYFSIDHPGKMAACGAKYMNIVLLCTDLTFLVLFFFLSVLDVCFSFTFARFLRRVVMMCENTNTIIVLCSTEGTLVMFVTSVILSRAFECAV
jgi:hypothetical protein